MQTKYQQAKADIEEFTAWSKKMEKHSQDTNNTLLELLGIIQKRGFVRRVLEEPSETTATSDGAAKN
ncbi:hypothetical protein F4809DRAFT_622788 [Biscogniauxia mediterranea]|nr:hypothetical protein F4809DRAFT_622788 [Biscogniauxia mediterranea]